MQKHYFSPQTIIPVRKEPSEVSEMVTQLLFGEIAAQLELSGEWQKIKLLNDGYEGWVGAAQLKPVPEGFENGLHFFISEVYLPARLEVKGRVPSTLRLSLGCRVPSFFRQDGTGRMWEWQDETIRILIPRQGLVPPRTFSGTELSEAARLFIGAPYLWGGRSLWGIECSGLTQMAFLLCGKTLPRDSSQQVLEGREVSFEEKQPGDLAFFKGKSGRVSHVGMITGEGRITHASVSVKEDHFLPDGILNVENQTISHKLYRINRYI